MLIQEILFENFKDFQYEQNLQESIDLILIRNGLTDNDYKQVRFSEKIGLLNKNQHYGVQFEIFNFHKKGKHSQLECYKSLKNDYYEFTQFIFE